MDAFNEFMKDEPKKTETKDLSPKQKLIADIEDLKGKLERHLAREPMEPAQEDCCGSGCTPCVFDSYYDKLEDFECKKQDMQMKIIEYEEELEAI